MGSLAKMGAVKDEMILPFDFEDSHIKHELQSNTIISDNSSSGNTKINFLFDITTFQYGNALNKRTP